MGKKDVNSFIEENIGEDGKLSSENTMEAFFMSMNDDLTEAPEGEEEVKAADDKAVDDSKPEENQDKEEEEVKASEGEDKPDSSDKSEEEVIDKLAEDPEKVILTRDEKHTIPYSELEKARNLAQEFKDKSEESDKKILDLVSEIDGLKEKMETAQESDRKTGTSEAMDKLLEDLEDIGEDYPAVPKIIKALQDTIAARDADLDSIRKEFEPIKQKLAENEKNSRLDAEEAHFAEIESKYKNFEDILESNEFAKWYDNLPSYVQEGIDKTMKNGSAKNVIAFLDDFTDATGTPYKKDTSTKSKAEVEREVQDKVKKAEEKTISSLSDVSGSKTPHHDEAEALLNMPKEQAFMKYLNMDGDKAMRTVEKVI